MKTTQITQLKEQGFIVQKTPDMNTVITHSKPFVIHGVNGVYKAPLKEGTYQITFASMCSKGETPFVIEQTPYPFINNIHACLMEQQRKNTQQQSDDDQPNVVATSFGNIKEGDYFYKDESKSSQYRKTGDCTYVKRSQLVESFDLICKADMQVFVEMNDIDISLTDDQKQNIVANMPAGLSPDRFSEQLSMEIENIPGLETMDDQQVKDLHTQLFALYQSMHA